MQITLFDLQGSKDSGMADPNTACDLCGNKSLELAYKPDSSGRALSVYVCRGCGLVQSLPRTDRAPRRRATISADADWGNVRYGKGFRVARHMNWLREVGRLPEQPNVLDVGANRGAFIEAAQLEWPDATVTAIEPDARVIDGYKNRDGVTLLQARLEDTDLPAASFDLVYSSHTLEHLASPLDALRDHARVMKPEALLLLEVPNIALIGGEDVVEEWFIDKHLFHFSATTLRFACHIAGFEILRISPPTELSHLTVLLKRYAKQRAAEKPDRSEGERASVLIERYKAVRKRNRIQLSEVARQIEDAEGKVVIWGAGRIFDTLVKYGQLDPSRISLLVDKNLPAYTNERHGIPVKTPEALADMEPDAIFIASRDFAEEIAIQARTLAPAARLITYSEALTGVARSPKPTIRNEANQ